MMPASPSFRAINPQQPLWKERAIRMLPTMQRLWPRTVVTVKVSFGLNVVSCNAKRSLEAEPQSLHLRLRRALRLHKHPSSESAKYSYHCELDQIIPKRKLAPPMQKKPTNHSKVDQHPVGYGKLAAIEGCDPDFRIYRKFDWLRNNALLYLQDELVELEEDLEALNGYDFTEKPIRLVSRRQNDGPDGLVRRELLTKIREKLAEYGE
jgi:hypothetical protein